MPTRIVLAPVGAGKTEIALTHLAQMLDSLPFARVWALLATRRQEQAFRQRLVEWATHQRTYFNVEFFNFYELYRRLLDMARRPVRQLSDTARYTLLRYIISEAQRQGRLSYYRSIAHTPGFIRILADFIYELKQNRVYPDDFERAAVSRKDHELALLYALYQDALLRNDLVDREGQGWLAVDALSAEESLVGDLSLLLVDGFDQFTPVQADLLALLADRALETLITLTAVPGRETTVGRRFDQALQRLEERFALPPQKEMPGMLSGDRHPDLQHLADQIFLPQPQSRASTGGITLLEAPDPAQEVSAVLRRVKALLLEGSQPDDILIVLRDWGLYYHHFAAFGKIYRLPLAMHYGQPLMDNPCIRMLLNLIQLGAGDFRCREVLDCLRSPYFFVPGITAGQVEQLERLSRQFHVVQGREEWLNAVQLAGRQHSTDRDDPDPPLLDAEEADNLLTDLDAFFAAVTPPEHATAAAYVEWVETLIGHDSRTDPDASAVEASEVEHGGYSLSVIAALRSSETPHDIVSRDLAAMQTFKQAMRSLITAQTLLASFDESAREYDWPGFLELLLAVVKNAAVDAHPNRSGCVLVTTAADARGLPHKHVFIMGLSEGVFPAPIPEDALYLDRERQQLASAGVRLSPLSERAADEGLFYELICLPRETLTLSRPAIQEGRLWIESHLWRNSAAVFSDGRELVERDRIRVGGALPAEAAASRAEAALAAAEGLNTAPEAVHEQTSGLYNWLLVNEPIYWRSVLHNRAVEAGRMSRRPYDRYSGRLSDERLIRYVAAALDESRRWSATQLNEYGVCGFRFFARRLLNLTAFEDTDTGLDAAQHGTLNHQILEQTYSRLRDEQITITSDNSGYARQLLRQVAARIFAHAPEEIAFRPGAAWEQEKQVILRKLESLIRLDFSDDRDNPLVKSFSASPSRRIYLLEVPFGIDDDDPVFISLGDEAGDLRVRGYIDRIDRLDETAVVMDYKSGSAEIPVDEMKNGRNFQMMVYLEAARHLLARDSDAPGRLAGGFFWHLANRKPSGTIRLEDGEHRDALERARARLADHLLRGRRGDFAVHASKLDDSRCARYCEFHRLCRINTTNRNKHES